MVLKILYLNLLIFNQKQYIQQIYPPLNSLMNRAKSPQTKVTLNNQRILPIYKKNAQILNRLLNQLLFKKLRYTFQILKQFYLFPDGSSSSVLSLEKYDKLIFSDQAIHTLVKKLQTKVLQRKIWGFLNLKMMRILKQVNNMTVKINKVIQKKQIMLKSYTFQKIKAKSIELSPIKRKLKDSSSQTKIISQQRIPSYKSIPQQQHSTTIISQTQQISYRMQPRVYVHRGSRSRSPSQSPNHSYTRILKQEQIKVYPRQYRGNSHIHQVTPKMVITQVTERSPAKNYFQVDQVRRQYRNCYRIAATTVRVVSCGCEHLLQKSCKCTSLMNRLCGCSSCCHSCEGCNRCNSCHSHCQCAECSRSRSKNKNVVKILKSPSKKCIEQRPNIIIDSRNNYLNHLESRSPRSQNLKYQYNETTRVTQIRR